MPPISLTTSDIRTPYLRASLALIFAASVIYWLFGQPNNSVGMLLAAVLLGWAEVDCECGASHVGSITPLRALDSSHKLWARAALGYLLGGLGSAGLVGCALGAIGVALLSSTHALALRSAVIVIIILLALREPFAIHVRLPQIRRQTNRMWAFDFGFGTAATMWGIHIGLGLFTVIKHGGLYALVLTALISGPNKASLILAAYWFGRALPVLVLPAFTPARLHRDGAAMGEIVLSNQKATNTIAVAGLLVLAATMYFIP